MFVLNYIVVLESFVYEYVYKIHDHVFPCIECLRMRKICVLSLEEHVDSGKTMECEWKEGRRKNVKIWAEMHSRALAVSPAVSSRLAACVHCG